MNTYIGNVMVYDLSIKHPELRQKPKQEEKDVTEETAVEERTETTQEETQSGTVWEHREDATIRNDGVKVVKLKDSSYMAVLADGTELRGPKGRLRTWRKVERAIEQVDNEFPQQ